MVIKSMRDFLDVMLGNLWCEHPRHKVSVTRARILLAAVCRWTYKFRLMTFMRSLTPLSSMVGGVNGPKLALNENFQ